MKTLIDNVQFNKEYESKFGTLYSFTVSWKDENGQSQKGYYSSKNKDQKNFVAGKEAEFNIEEKQNDRGNYFVIKPVKAGQFSGFNRNLKKEQSRYTTMGASYVKDLIIAGKIDIKDWERATEKIVKFMFNLDKDIESV